MHGIFSDRRRAGKELARVLARRHDLESPVVLALPRGGVPVGLEVARALDGPLDVMVVRKLGLPGQPELAMGAVASGGIRVVNEEVLRQARVSDGAVEAVAAEETAEVERRERAYRGDRPPVDLRGRTVILVDDGIATGSTVRAAARAVRARGAETVIVATPVAPVETCEALAREVDGLVCLATPEPFIAISLWYRSFPQLADDDVRAILDEAAREGRGPA
jgi:putative phosphoribosyl transferase